MVSIVFTADPGEHAAGLRELLAVADDEFHPPLSGRDGTTQTAGLDERRNDALDDYLGDLLSQPLVAALDGDRLVGFLSFRRGYETEALGEFAPSNYASTLIVHPDYRRRGYARRLYHRLLTDVPERYRDPYVTTRTWSTNESHLSLLDELGFENLATIEDDRGEGIHTVYYGIPVDEYDPEVVA